MKADFIDSSFFKTFSLLEDYREKQGQRHPLINIIAITVCAVIAGGDCTEDIVDWGLEHNDWLSQFLDLKHGIPSEPTIRRFFQTANSSQIEQLFIDWVETIRTASAKLVSIDGKSVRRSFNTSGKENIIHMVSAWSSDLGLSLGQVKTDKPFDEKNAIPKLLDLLNLDGATVTIDAIACDKNITSKIISKGADYIVGLKGNQKHLQKRVKDFFDKFNPEESPDLNHHRSVSKGHGRIEERNYWSFNASPFEVANWTKLNSIIVADSRRIIQGKETHDRRYFISSLCETNIDAIANAIRSHWSIENTLHYVLDVTFNEDQSRARTKNAAENLSIIRRMAINFLKRDKTPKLSIRRKRKKAGWNTDYLEQILLMNRE